MWWHNVKDIKEGMQIITDRLEKIEERLYSVELAQKTLDKFEDYMKNVDKLNGMINELKGCASMARGAVMERKQADTELTIALGSVSKYAESASKESSKKMNSMSKLLGKIAEKLQVCEKKSRKKRKRIKNEPDFPEA